MINKRIGAQIPILFGIISWLHMMFTGWPFFSAIKTEMNANLPSVFNVLAWMSYSFIYIAPSLLLVWAVGKFFPKAKTVLAAVAIISTSATVLFIRADSVIYDLYNFHFNGFVVNLIMTPGGVESLGGGTDTYISIALTTLGHIAAQFIGWFLSVALATTGLLVVKPLALLLMILGVSLGERVIYGISDIKNNGAILEQAKAYPFYTKTKFRTLAGWLGIKPAERSSALMAEVSGKSINYPLAPVDFAPVKNPPNIVILVAESLRWDRLNPDVMPNTWQFAQKSQHFLNHYSSGNGTREGLFGLFYGLYGSYWSPFLATQKSPLLMDRLQALNYQFDLRTSARFSYPEFNKTLFAKIPLDVQHEAAGTKEPWERDEDNAAELIKFLKGRDKNKPFMSFMFFESTHARYDFPESAIIAKPYLESVNYASMSRESLRPQIGQLFNRYTNAAHWVDQQMGRIYAALAQEGLLENTIVIVTGDHGEEFMEKGFWGHNSSFVQEQTRTPMVISMPGRGHQEINYLTSHLDISTTLLQQLGAPQDNSSYSLGSNIFDVADKARYIVSSDWHSIGIIHPNIKYRISYNNRGMDNWEPTRLDDAAVSDAEAKQMLSDYRAPIMDAIQNTSKFIARDKK